MTRQEFWAQEFARAAIVRHIDALPNTQEAHQKAAEVLTERAGLWADLALGEFDKRFHAVKRGWASGRGTCVLHGNHEGPHQLT